MNYFEFRNQFFDLACFNVHQVYAWQPDFNKNNLSRWLKQGKLIKLRNAWYCFPEYLEIPNFQYFISNKIYSPSYVSVHTALSFYGIIPEAIATITAVGTLKKVNFENSFGTFSYQRILPELMFGYESKPILSKMNFLLATPEKAILDFLYLYPLYNSEQEIRNLRFDEDFMQQELNMTRLEEYAGKFQSKALDKRLNFLLKINELC